MASLRRKILSWLRFESGERRVARLIREDVARTWGKCPMCSRSLDRHAYHDLAFTAAGSAGDADALERTKHRQWRGLREHREADMQSDLHVWQLVKCPSGGMAVGLLYSPYDYSQRTEMMKRIILSPEESAEMEEAVDGAWKEL